MKSLFAAIAAVLVFAGVAFAGAFPDGPNGPMIQVVNVSKTVPAATLAAELPAFQKYLDQVCAAWHCSGTLYMGKRLSSRDWKMVINDVSDEPGAIGYHDLKGNPIAYVSAETAALNNVEWSEVFSHELSEMLIDPNIGLWARNDSLDRFYALEVADPVQGHTYKIDGVPMSDYVYRSWFTPGAKGPFDSMRALSSPFQLWTYGWAIIYENGRETTIGNLVEAKKYGEG